MMDTSYLVTPLTPTTRDNRYHASQLQQPQPQPQKQQHPEHHGTEEDEEHGIMYHTNTNHHER